MRTRKSIINMIVALIVQVELICLGFVSRKIFLNILSVEYLGCNSVFSNVIEIISVVGCGATAVSYLAIKAMASDDEVKINKIFKIIHYYQWITCGLLLVIGGAASFFLNTFLQNTTNFEWSFLQIVYFLYLFDLCISMWSGINGTPGYYDCVIRASQNNAICSVMEFLVKNICILLQIAFLLTTKSYYLYLFSGILTKLIYILLSRIYCYRKFPFLKKKCQITKDDVRETNLFKEIRSNLAISVAIVIFNGTDNLVLTGALGITVTGLYSNYELFYNQLRNLISKFINGMSASIGNFIHKKDNYAEKLDLFNSVQLMCAIIAVLCSNLYFNLAQSFIIRIFGEDLLLDLKDVLAVAVLCFITVYSNSCSMFRHPVGQYWIDVGYQIASAAVNLILSLAMAPKYGIIGILFGTMVGILVSNTGYLKVIRLISIEGWNKNEWYASFIGWLTVDILSILATHFAVSRLDHSIISIVLRGITAVAVSVSLMGLYIIIVPKEKNACRSLISRAKKYIQAAKSK